MVLDVLPLRLESRARRQIANNPRDEQNPALLRLWVQELQRGHPAATIRSATSVYNCFGLAFASRRTWIFDEAEVRKVLQEDRYRRIAREDLREGDLILYALRPTGVDHIGVAMRFDLADPTVVWVLSQWGQYGEWLHRMEDVPPLMGTPAEFWTHRRPV